MGSNGVRLSVDDDVFELEVGDAGGVELVAVWPVCLDGDVEIFEEDVADVGLARVGPDSPEGGVRALDADEVQVLDNGFRRFHALEIEILRPRRHVDDATRWAFGGDVAEGDVLVVLGGVGAQLQSCDADAAGDFAVFGDDVADDGGLAAAGQNTPAALEDAVADADVLDGRAVLVLHGVRTLGAFAGYAVVGDGEDAAIDCDVARAVDVDAIGAGGLPVVVGNLEVDVMH